MCGNLWKADTGRLLIGHLRKYQLALGSEWELLFNRTHKSIIEGKFMDEYPIIGEIVWRPEVHHSHRVHLLKKDSAHYRPKFDIFDLPIDEEWVKYDWSRPTTV
tara:strand:- start:73 stop:384 length:312 start_codon:yes stop_codon:yes gene_type:complete